MSLRWLWGAVLLITVVMAFAADATGAWIGEMTVRGESRNFTMELTSRGADLTGTLRTGAEAVSILNGRVDGNTIVFEIPTGFKDVPYFKFQGEIDSETIKLTISGNGPDGTPRKLGDASAKRTH